MSHFWSNGDFELPINDHPWLRADGIIETLKSVKGEVYFLTRHMNRLSSAIIDLHMERSELSIIRNKIVELVLEDGFEMGRVRLTYFANGDFLISHQEIPPSANTNKGLSRLSVSEFPRFSHSVLNRYKTMSYTESTFGQRMAKSQGFDDLLYVNEKDEITETGFANVLLEIDGKLITPARECGVLAGVVRDLLLEWFPHIQERIVARSELSRANGIYLLSSIREIELVSEIRDGSSTYRFEPSDQVQAMKIEYLKRSKSEPDS